MKTYEDYMMSQPMTDGEEIRSFFEELDKPKTVKLVVEIPEGKYRALQKWSEEKHLKFGLFEKAILHGTPVKMGRWIYTKAVSTGEIIWSECSVCGEGEHGCAKRMKFCPHCGAKMDERSV